MTKKKYSIDDTEIENWNYFHICVKNHDIFIIILNHLMGPAVVLGPGPGP